MTGRGRQPQGINQTRGDCRAVSINEAADNSRVVQLWRNISEKVEAYSSNSRVVSAISSTTEGDGQQALNQTQSEVSEAANTASVSENSQSAQPSESTTSEQRQSPVATSSSVTLAATIRVKQFILSSWLYTWLTKEPEPEVIVIDLRETRSVGPIISILDTVGKEVTTAAPTSRLTRLGYRVRSQFAAQPVRIAGIIGLAVALIGVAGVAVSEEPVQPTLFAFLAIAIVSLRLSQSTMSWSTLRQTQTVQLLIRLLEPPEPPESSRDRRDEEN